MVDRIVQGKYTNAFVSAGHEHKNCALDLTYCG